MRTLLITSSFLFFSFYFKKQINVMYVNARIKLYVNQIPRAILIQLLCTYAIFSISVFLVTFAY